MLTDVLAQTTDPVGGGWSDILATYGPFAPFAMLLLFILQLLWKDNKEKEAEIKRLSETAMEKVLPLVLDATRVLSQAIDTLKESHERTRDTVKMIDLMEELVISLDGLKKTIATGVATPRKRAAPTRDNPRS